MAATAGCACNEAGMRGDYGDSYKTAIANQTLHPEAAQNLAARAGMDAPESAKVYEKLRQELRKTGRTGAGLTSSPSATREAGSNRDNEKWRGRRRSFMKNSRGTTAIEFALILPVFAFLIFGIVDMGYYMFVQHTLQFATAEGARLAMVGGTLNGTNGDPLSRAASIVAGDRQRGGPRGHPLFGPADQHLPDHLHLRRSDGLDGRAGRGEPRGLHEGGDRLHLYILHPLHGAVFSRTGSLTITAQTTYRNELFWTRGEAAHE